MAADDKEAGFDGPRVERTNAKSCAPDGGVKFAEAFPPVLNMIA
jgi:hypothetical protein